MKIRRYVAAALLAVCLPAWLSGCRKPELQTVSEPSPFAVLEPLNSNSVLRVHWVGKKRLGVMANAYYLTRLWGLPESRRLEWETLQKLSTAPWRLAHGEAAAANAPAAFLRPLLDDLVERECFFESRSDDSGSEAVVAVRLDETRAGLWRTNLVAVVASLTGIQTMDVTDGGSGWVMKQESLPRRFELSRAGGWTVFGVGDGTNALMDAVLSRVQQFESSFSTNRSKNWLCVDIGSEILRGGGSRLVAAALRVTGDGGNVHTTADLHFAEGEDLQLEEWLLPTNVLRGPVISFAAFRNLDAWLPDRAHSALPFERPLPQLFVWALDQSAYHAYAAVPMTNAEAVARQLVDQVVSQTNPWLTSRGYVPFLAMTNGTGAIWDSLPPVMPFFMAAGSPPHGALFAGMTASDATLAHARLPNEIAQTITTSSNAVALGWEQTGHYLLRAGELNQLMRTLLRRAQLPADSAGAAWIRALAPRLNITETKIDKAGPRLFKFERRSSIGFAAHELHLIADWLESAHFPSGLQSAAGLPSSSERR